MLNVYGMVVIPSEPQLRITEGSKGSYLNFQVVSQDNKKTIHRYNANLWIPNEEVNEWKDKVSPGNIFFISAGRWTMKEYEGGKYPIPQLNLDRFNFKKLVKPYWEEGKKESNE